MRRGFLEEGGLTDEERRELDGRTRAWRALGKAEERSSPELQELLLSRPPAERRELIRRRGRFASHGLVLHLVDGAREAGFRDPLQALELARLAREVAEGLEAAGYPPGIAADALALAWAGVANAHRIRGELVEGRRAMRSARRFLAEGSGDPGTRAEVLSLEGSLLTDGAYFEEAIAVLEEAAGIRRVVEDRVGEGKILVQLGNATGEAGEPERAARLLEEARQCLAEGAPGELGLIVTTGLVEWLRAAGRLEEAHRAWEELHEEIEGREMSFFLRQRVAWAGARLAWSDGHPERAENELRAVRAAYLERGEDYRYCLVSLDLGLLYLEQGRTELVRRLAQEMVPVFASHRMHHQALQALVIFQRAVEAETVTVALLDDLARYLRRAANNPYLVYEGGR
jgi:tetratricopeptide (TPR) repeat protein